MHPSGTPLCVDPLFGSQFLIIFVKKSRISTSTLKNRDHLARTLEISWIQVVLCRKMLSMPEQQQRRINQGVSFKMSKNLTRWCYKKQQKCTWSAYLLKAKFTRSITLKFFDCPMLIQQKPPSKSQTAHQPKLGRMLSVFDINWRYTEFVAMDRQSWWLLPNVEKLTR